jgi:hypothetical protein
MVRRTSKSLKKEQERLDIVPKSEHNTITDSNRAVGPPREINMTKTTYTIKTTRAVRVLYTAGEIGAARAIQFRAKHGDTVPTIALVPFGAKKADHDMVKNLQFRTLKAARSAARRIEVFASQAAGKLGQASVNVCIEASDGRMLSA